MLNFDMTNSTFAHIFL